MRSISKSIALALSLVALAGEASAQGAPIGETPFEVMLRWRPRAPEPDAPDFVRASRPPQEQMRYAPLTGPQPNGPPRRSPDDLAKLKSGLDAAAAQNKARAARDFAIGAPKPKKRSR